MDKVIFDTNFLIEKRLKNFFGKQDELEKFSKTSEIVIPDMVIGELKERYKRDFLEEKEKFNKVLLCNIAEHNINDIEIEKKIEDLLNSEKIKYTEIELKNLNRLFEMKDLALKKLPPFENKPGTDKGFKDAYIYFTVLDYLREIKDKQVFFVTDDVMLTSAFKENRSVEVVKNYDDFIQKNISLLCDDYFLEKLEEELEEKITKKNIENYWINSDENYVFLVKIKDKKYRVEVEQMEILAIEEPFDFSKNIHDLVNSNNFITTEEIIEVLDTKLNFLSNDEISKIFNASVENENIFRQIDNANIKSFIGKLFDKKSELIIDDEIKIKISNLVNNGV